MSPWLVGANSAISFAAATSVVDVTISFAISVGVLGGWIKASRGEESDGVGRNIRCFVASSVGTPLNEPDMMLENGTWRYLLTPDPNELRRTRSGNTSNQNQLLPALRPDPEIKADRDASAHPEPSFHVMNPFR